MGEASRESPDTIFDLSGPYHVAGVSSPFVLFDSILEWRPDFPGLIVDLAETFRTVNQTHVFGLAGNILAHFRCEKS
jgi:hypothetical protein